MLLGCARREIVLPEGFLPREGFTAQAHPLYARALLLGGEAPLLLVSLELTSLPDTVAARLQSAAARRAQISEKSVLIAATHTFSAPHIAPEEAGQPGALLRAVEDAVLAAVGQALNDLREAEFSVHIGESAVPANRDIKLPEGWWVGCGGAGETDGALTVLRGETAGMTRLLLVHLNVQPSVLDQTGAADGKCVSGDLAGVACAALERRIPGATAIFLVGAAGDQAPAKKACGYAPDGKGGWKKIDLREQGVALAEEFGNRLAREAEQAISGGGEPLAGGARIVSASVRLPLKRMPRSLQEMRPMRKCEWTPDGEGTQSVALLTLGELAVVCVRPELTCATGRAIRAESPFKHTLVATMVNGAAKYMPHLSAYAQCRYEAQNSPFMPGSAETLAERAIAMLREAAEERQVLMNDTIDFSPKANILLEDEHGQRTPMSEPYYRAELIAPGTWRILSDGDYSYLLEGEDGSALLIDTGYGAGNIRKYCEALCGRSVPWVVCTHHHFDHTALCGYFDLAFMAAESVPLATIPYPSFEGIDFPRNYATQIVEDGDTVPLPGRDLLVFKLPDHAPGSIALLDKKGRILFGGDEFGMDFGKPLSGSVEHWAKLMERLAPYRGEYDAVWCGPGRADDDIVKKLLDNCRAVLAGAEGEPWTPPPFHAWQTTDEQGRTVWKRRLPHPGDGPKEERGESAFKRRYGKPPAAIVYDIRRIHETPVNRKEGSSMSKVIDANLYWFPEALFTDEALSERFLSEIPAQYGIRGSLKVNPETGLRQYVIEKPVGSENLNYVQGDYVLEKQLRDMDKAGVDRAVLKLSCQQEWMSLDMCRLFNDGMAAHVKASGGRMAALGVVPPQGTQAVFREIDRCLNELGFGGLQLSAHYGDLYLDDEAFAPFFAYLNERGVTCYVHHTPVPVQYDSLTAYTNLRRSYGRCIDQATAIGRELFSGFFTKYPNVKLVHSMLGGGFFAYTSLWFPKRPKAKEAVSRFKDDNELVVEQLKRNVFFEMSHAQPWGKAQLECAVKALGADHIVFGSSYPVRPAWLLEGADFVRSLDITEEEKELILHGNAERLYRL